MSDVETLDNLNEPSIKPKRRRTDAELDITPMIDIVFLLLAFFVVASKMDPQAVSELPLARNGKAVLIKNSVVLMVYQEGEMIHVLGGEKGEKTFTTADEELQAEIEDYVRLSIDSNPKIDTVVIKGEKKVQNKYMQPVFLAAKAGAPEGFEIRAAVEERK